MNSRYIHPWSEERKHQVYLYIVGAGVNKCRRPEEAKVK